MPGWEAGSHSALPVLVKTGTSFSATLGLSFFTSREVLGVLSYLPHPASCEVTTAGKDLGLLENSDAHWHRISWLGVTQLISHLPRCHEIVSWFNRIESVSLRLVFMLQRKKKPLESL